MATAVASDPPDIVVVTPQLSSSLEEQKDSKTAPPPPPDPTRSLSSADLDVALARLRGQYEEEHEKQSQSKKKTQGQVQDFSALLQRDKKARAKSKTMRTASRKILQATKNTLKMIQVTNQITQVCLVVRVDVARDVDEL